MTGLDLAFAYPDQRASRLSQSAQRVLMALMVLALLEALLLPALLLDKLTGYTDPGGMPLLKIHFYTYTLLLAFALVAHAVGLVRFVSDQAIEHPGVLQFAAVIVLCAAITIARQGIGGVGYMANTLFAAPLAVMLALYLDEERRQKLTVLIIWFVTFNAAFAVCERLAGVNLFVFPVMGGVDYFRATALMGHPLENAFITSSVMVLVPAMPWSTLRKFSVLAVSMAGILAFGARSSFAATLVVGAAACSWFACRALLRGEMRVSTLAAAPWIGLLACAAGGALMLGTSLGERIVQLAKIDTSAQARVDVWQVFDYLNAHDLLYGVDTAEISFLLKTYNNVSIIENCWIAIFLMMGGILFVIFVLSLLGFLWSLALERGAIAFFAIMNFLLVASTSNSLKTQTASLVIFAVALIGVPARRDARLRRISLAPAQFGGL